MEIGDKVKVKSLSTDEEFAFQWGGVAARIVKIDLITVTIETLKEWNGRAAGVVLYVIDEWLEVVDKEVTEIEKLMVWF